MYHILEVPGSNFGLKTGYANLGFHCFVQYLLANPGIIPQIRTWTHFSMSFPIHYLLIIILPDPILSKLLTTALNKTKIIKQALSEPYFHMLKVYILNIKYSYW